MSRKLAQYVKHERRRAGFTQADVAYLFGARARTKISRYERGRYLPTLRTALGYEAMFGVPVAELFPGAFRDAQRAIVRRARCRTEILSTRYPQTARTVRRQRSLEKLLA